MSKKMENYKEETLDDVAFIRELTYTWPITLEGGLEYEHVSPREGGGKNGNRRQARCTLARTNENIRPLSLRKYIWRGTCE
jgi:hypothetical protein